MRPSIEGDLQAWEYLRGLKATFVQALRRERTLRLLGLANPAAKLFHVTDEFRFTNNARAIRADVVLFINGAPVVIVGTRAATRLERIGMAPDQVRRYERATPKC